jgi:hypothetical protein
VRYLEITGLVIRSMKLLLKSQAAGLELPIQLPADQQTLWLTFYVDLSRNASLAGALVEIEPVL